MSLHSWRSWPAAAGRRPPREKISALRSSCGTEAAWDLSSALPPHKEHGSTYDDTDSEAAPPKLAEICDPDTIPVEELDYEMCAWCELPNPNTPQLRQLQRHSRLSRGVPASYVNRSGRFMPYLDPAYSYSERIAKSPPLDYEARAAALIYAHGGVRLGDRTCGRCRAKAAEEGSCGIPVPFVACVSAGVVLDDVCCRCVSEGGSWLEMIERCDVSFKDIGIGDATAEQVRGRYDVVDVVQTVQDDTSPAVVRFDKAGSAGEDDELRRNIISLFGGPKS